MSLLNNTNNFQIDHQIGIWVISDVGMSPKN